MTPHDAETLSRAACKALRHSRCLVVSAQGFCFLEALCHELGDPYYRLPRRLQDPFENQPSGCLLYTSDAADE